MDFTKIEAWWDGVDKRRLIGIALVFAVTFGVSALVRWNPGLTYQVGRDQVDAGTYATLGDACIYAGVLILGVPWSVIVAGVAMAAADIATGSKLYIIGTLFIKAGMAYFIASFALQCNSWKRCFAVAAVAELIMFVAYFFYDLMFVSFAVAVRALPVNLLQAVVCGAVGAVILKYLPPQRPKELPRVVRRPRRGDREEEYAPRFDKKF